MLTCTTFILKVKEFKMKIKNKFYIKSITFTTFKTLNAQIPKKKTFYISYVLKAQANIFFKKNIKINVIIIINCCNF